MRRCISLRSASEAGEIVDFWVWVVLAFVLAFIPSAIAKGKGHGATEWWIFGFLLFVIALPMSLLLKPASGFIQAEQRAAGMKKCPDCAEMVQGEALKCRFCGRVFEVAVAPIAQHAEANTTTAGTKLAAVLAILALLGLFTWLSMAARS